METKIIKAVFGAVKSIVTQHRYRYDYGQIIEVSGITLPESFEARFSNSPTGTSVRVLGSNQRVAVPDELMQSGQSIWCYITVHDAVTDGRTMYTIRIPIKDATERTDAEPTPVQQDIISQAIAALNSAVAQTAQDVESADASAESARTDAESAQASATTAVESAQSANQSAVSASQSAQSATASAESAEQSAQSAVESAQSANQSAVSASQSAQSATASAQSASASAQTAQTAQQTATTKASEAQQSAQIATTKAQEASQSASESSQSAQTAVQAKQDAESAKTASETAQASAESARDDAESARDEAQQYAESIDPQKLISAYPVDTASGSIASFTDGADNIPMKSVKVRIEPVQDLSKGDPSPDNICPISGWTGVNVSRVGVNVWDEEWEVGGLSPSDGQPIASSNSIRSKNFIPCLPNMAYYTRAVNPASFLWFYDGDKNFISFVTNSANNAVTTPSNCRYMKLRVGDRDQPLQSYNHDISINYPSTDQDYHPYTGRSITIDLGQTVYGGYLDVISGVMTVDRAMVDLATVWWSVYDTTNKRWNTQIQAMKSTTSRSDKVWSDRWRTFKQATAGDEGVIFGYLNYVYFYTSDTNNTPIGQLMYELATPITLALTPTEVRSLLGDNNLWADTGDTTAVYRADTTLYINRKIAEAVSALS